MRIPVAIEYSAFAVDLVEDTLDESAAVRISKILPARVLARSAPAEPADTQHRSAKD